MSDNCTCRNRATNRIGEVIAPNGAILVRFALDCPAHGIVVHKGEDDAGNEVAEPGENQGEAQSHT